MGVHTNSPPPCTGGYLEEYIAQQPVEAKWTVIEPKVKGEELVIPLPTVLTLKQAPFYTEEHTFHLLQ